METSVARVGGNLEINCKDYGHDVPHFYNGGKPVKSEHYVNGAVDGSFVIGIDSQFRGNFRLHFKCVCGSDTGLESTTFSVKEVLCSLQDPLCQENTELCLLQTDGTGKCQNVGSSDEICVSDHSGLRSPKYNYKVLAAKVAANEYCNALKIPENEEWGQVELLGLTAAEIIHPLFSKCKRLLSFYNLMNIFSFKGPKMKSNSHFHENPLGWWTVPKFS